LHDGHASLLHRARAECDRVVATVFVNPLQFGAGEDFSAYPRQLERDVGICGAAGADVVFAPERAAIYPEGFASHIGVGREAQGLEGEVRPGHFGGVATVVAKLLVLGRPARAYFGEKDAQQLAVIRRLVKDLGLPVDVRGCPIVREPDGLARSSRNVYLGPRDRAAAPVLFRALSASRARFRAGERDQGALRAAALAVVATEPRCQLDYLELRAEGDLSPLPPGPLGACGARLLVAARFTTDSARPTRLIDNASLAGADGTED
jgi:pantoate--beta-alanine ligase